MSASPVTFRLADVVHEVAEDGDWVAPVPDGPIIQVQGSGSAILALLEEASGADEGLSVADLLAKLREEVDDIPDGAAETVGEFLEHLERSGVVQRVS